MASDSDESNYSQPILFYAGNEGDIWDFYDNTGFISELANMTGGMVVYAEHRYFGLSYPFPQDVALKAGNNQWLTVEQTMMDYVELLKELKKKHSFLANQPVIAIGGSYGGMLAAYLRMKYPNMIQGAVASSAPVLYFANGTVEYTAFDDRVTKVFNETFPDARCGLHMKEGFAQMKETEDLSLYYDQFNTIFNPCEGQNVTNATDFQRAWETLQSGLEYMAMINYPYNTSFLMPVPGNPIEYACVQAYNDSDWAMDSGVDHDA